MSDAPEWVPLIEGARMIGRQLAGEKSDWIEIGITQKARGLFSAVAREGAVAGEGWRDGADEREKLTADDWISHRIDFDRNRLEPQEPTMRRVHPERIRDVVVDARDVLRLLKSLAADAGDASKASGLEAGPTPLATTKDDEPPASTDNRRTGVAGRPSSAWLCVAELQKRIANNEAYLSTRKETAYLAEWLRDNYKDEAPLQAKALSNNADVQRLMNTYKAMRPK